MESKFRKSGKIWRILLRYTIYTVLFFIISSIFFVLIYTFINPPITPLMVIRCTGQLFGNNKVILKKKWVPLDQISPEMALAVVASEDNLFLLHNGFDFDAIKKASSFNKRYEGKKMRGASTISQQTAKNVFLWPQRSWIRKGLEVYFTALIELVWSKRRIMEVYLNVIETGDGIYGVEQASEIYFNKPASRLTRSQAAILASILPDPRKRNPDHPTRYILQRQSWILWNMDNIGKLDY
jgi:monofunctional glycosyltransferase